MDSLRSTRLKPKISYWDELPARDEQRWGLRCHEESTKSKVPNTKALLKFPAEQNQR